jgi:hypothetical protein
MRRTHYGVFDSDVVQAFRPARHGGPEGPHYTKVENAPSPPQRATTARRLLAVCGSQQLIEAKATATSE